MVDAQESEKQDCDEEHVEEKVRAVNFEVLL
jgi:hypothetical protein